MTRAHYGRLLTEAYDLDKPEAPPAMAAFYLSQVRAQSVEGPVLEAMCGSGRFLVPLLEAGIEVDGVDSSPDMLRAALWRLRQRGLRASLVEQWLHALDLGRQYAFALCVAGSFGLVIGDDEVAASLRRLREHVLPGGALLVETEAPRESRRRDGIWRGRTWPTHDGALLVERAITTYDAATQVETGVNIYERWVEGALLATELNDWACRFWAPDAFEAQLRAAGFEDVEVAGRAAGVTAFLARA
jgi:SAM-dependent methyltransferase